MKIKEHCLADFQQLMLTLNNEIRCVDGCKHLEVLNDKADNLTIFSMAIWESEKAIDKYKKTDLYKTVWKQLNEYIAGEPHIWTVENFFDKISKQ